MRAAFLAAVVTAMCVTSPASAQSWPERGVKIVVPFTPGGPTDVYARIAGEILQRKLGQSFVIENKPGAGGNPGTLEVARATPDGYTLHVGGVSTHAVNQTLYANSGFDAVNDFEHVAIIAGVSNVLYVHPSVKARSLKEFIAEIKSSREEMPYPMPGIGTSPHLASEMMRVHYDLPMKQVAYRGATPAMSDIIAGHIKMMFNNIDNALPQINAGTVRALAVTSQKRVAALPDVPTFIESGAADFFVTGWINMSAPRGTPAAIVERINKLVIDGMNEPAMAKRLGEQGVEANQMSPQDVKAFVTTERARWGRFIRETGMKVQ